MANRYIRHGATYCGDGTTSALATVNGGPGAWNDITYFEGTTPAYGTLPAGTNVYIRSKDEAGDDITVGLSAGSKTFCSSAATVQTPITWVFDDGAVWPDAVGVITYTQINGTSISIAAYNDIVCSPDNNLVFTSTTGNYMATFRVMNSRTTNLKVDYSGVSTSGSCTVTFMAGIQENPYLILGRGNGVSGFINAVGANKGRITLINPRVELSTTNAAAVTPLFAAAGQWGVVSFVIYGGEVSGPGTLANWPVCSITAANGAAINLFGFRFPKNMPLASSLIAGSFVTSIGEDGELSSSFMDAYYSYSSRLDRYYPTLNAKLETSGNMPWSYYIYPFDASTSQPVSIAISKTYTQDPASKTVVVSLLWPDSMGTPTADSVYAVVQFTSAAGVAVSKSSFRPAAEPLQVSSALWSQTTYGPTIFTKYVIAIPTVDAIKKDSMVLVNFIVTKKSATSDDFLFLCPDPVLS